MTDFLLELLSEEIPARMQEKAAADLARLFEGELARAGFTATAVETFVTPRRLALIARGLPQATEPTREETKGPRASAPPQALEGFLRKIGLTRDQLTERDGILFAVVEKPGRATADVLAEAVPAVIRAFPWPKSMRWGAASASTESLRWVRPLQGIVAILGEDLVPLEVDGIRSGYATVGHRFHHPGVITIGGAHDYGEKLRACHVIVAAAERRRLVHEGAEAAAAAAGLRLVPDDGLVAENAGLTEWPVPLLGAFDPAFLEVPREVIQLTMRTNQKYFACVDGEGALAPAFVCTANIDAADGGAAIVAGNRKVLAARLSDARFFWEQDLKVPLADRLPQLEKIVFHEKLGTVADKVERVARLARWLVEEGVVKPKPIPFRGGVGVGPVSPGAAPAETPHLPASSPEGEEERRRLADLAEQAARLCKADLVTGMVGEFPELQGIMGGYYARAEGLRPEVADAIHDHYKPVGQGDEVPTAPVTVAVSLADKLDTIAGFFLISEKPTGSKDPFALRRAAIGLVELTLANGLRFETMHLFARSAGYYHRQLEKRTEHQADEWAEGLGKLFTADFYGSATDFLIDRLKVQQRSVGTRHDLMDAVFATDDDQPVRLLARVKALQAFVGSEDGANLLVGYRRAANILKKENFVAPAEAGAHVSAAEAVPAAKGDMDSRLRGNDGGAAAYAPEPAEVDLAAALDVAEPAAAAAVEREDFAAAMAALAGLRGPIDAFFDHVTVNDPDPAKRLGRLALLARIRAAMHAVADFSKIEG